MIELMNAQRFTPKVIPIDRPVIQSHMDVYGVSPGIKITCTAGHHVCTVVEPLVLGDVARLECFGNWQITPPQPNEEKETTCHCGASFTRAQWAPEGSDLKIEQSIHTELGWWPQ